MPDTTVTQFVHKMILTEITDVQVSDLTLADGIYSRAVRFYGTPSGQNIPPVLEVQIKSDVADNLKIVTPGLPF